MALGFIGEGGFGKGGREEGEYWETLHYSCCWLLSLSTLRHFGS